MTVHRDDDVVTLPVQLEVQGNAEWNRPPAGEKSAVDVDDEDVLGPDLLPQEQPRRAQQRSVGLPDGDVPGEMVVVALPPEGPGEQHQFLPRPEPGQQRAG